MEQVDPGSKEVVAVYKSQSQAAYAVGGSQQLISNACRGIIPEAHGYLWRFHNEWSCHLAVFAAVQFYENLITAKLIVIIVTLLVEKSEQTLKSLRLQTAKTENWLWLLLPLAPQTIVEKCLLKIIASMAESRPRTILNGAILAALPIGMFDFLRLLCKTIKRAIISLDAT